MWSFSGILVCFLVPLLLHSGAAQHDSREEEQVVKNTEQTVSQMVDKIYKHLKEQEGYVEKKFNEVQNALKKAEQSIMEKVQTLIREQGEQLARECSAQHTKVIESIDSYRSEIAQISGSATRLEAKGNNIVATQSELRKQLDTITDELGATQINVLPSSCATVTVNVTNTYYIRPRMERVCQVLCDFEDNYHFGGGWTVFQRRFDGSVDFYRNWAMYKNGFGDVRREHWLGLDKLHALTRTGQHELLVLLEDFEGNSTYAHYGDFKIGSETNNYKLTVGEYSGTAGDALSLHNGKNFTTMDQNNHRMAGKGNCAVGYEGAWWFNECHHSHLNGKYYQKGATMQKLGSGLIWNTFKGNLYSLKATRMMLRARG